MKLDNKTNFKIKIKYKQKVAKFRQHVLAEGDPHLSCPAQQGRASIFHGLLLCSFPGPVKALVLPCSFGLPVLSEWDTQTEVRGAIGLE